MDGLFRDEVVQAQRPRSLGTIRLATPISHQLWAIIAALMTAAIVAWLFFGHYTRRAHVAGSLVPQAGLLNITARAVGTVTQLDVAQGAHVQAGTALLTISSDRRSAAMGDTAATIAAELRKQRTKLQSDVANTRRMAKEESANLRMQQRMLRRQIQEIDAQLAIERKQVNHLSALLHRIQPLIRKQYVSALLVQQQRTEVSNARAEVKALQRQRTQSEQQLASASHQLAELPLSTSSKLNDLARQLAQNQQALAQNAASWAAVLQAPSDGVVSSVLVHPGQAVKPGQTLVTVMPKGSALQARLLVPSSAVGFVHDGTPVVLHYQAFPYQKFGVQRGTVTGVSRSALTPAELTELLGRAPPPEPLYRVTVRLPSQSIAAYGKRHALLPGMVLDADLLLDRRRMIEWIFEPLYGMGKRSGGHT